MQRELTRSAVVWIWTIALCWTGSLVAACSGGGGASATGSTRAPANATTPLVLTAGLESLDPGTDAGLASALDLTRLGVAATDAVFELTTPSGQPFRFNLVSRADGNTGTVRISVAHALSGGVTPVAGAESLADAGIIPEGAGTTNRGVWLDVVGDGFSRLTLSGRVDRDHVLAVETETQRGKEVALVRLKIGPSSKINPVGAAGGNYGGIKDARDLYSSDSWRFGLPTVATAGDRTSVVCYDGDQADPWLADRYEMRLQYDRLTGQVTGGAEVEAGADSGNWRDHEIAALFNVLAVVRSGQGDVTIRLSFDRGATFAQSERFSTGANGYRPRLVQTAIAADYTLSVLYWRTTDLLESELVLVEGAPSAFDATGSPTAFAFSQPALIYRDRGDVTPFLMGASYSQGGDLVLGYAFTRFTSNPDRTWTNLTQYRCATRLFGEASFRDVLVEEDLVTGMDPSIALIGSGAGLTIFYAYEARDGVRLRTSTDGGRSFSAPETAGGPGAVMPSVLARRQSNQTRVDLVYLGQGTSGRELHLRHWDSYAPGRGSDFRLTTATMTPTSASAGGGQPVPGGGPGLILPPTAGLRITHVAFFGYDATLDGDDVVVVYDEETYDAFTICGGIGAPVAMPAPQAAGSGASAGFVAATPPPLAPGLTQPVRAPQASHMHQLRLLRLD